MLSLIAFGIIPVEFEAGTGPIQADPDQIIIVRPGTGATGGTNLPVGAPVWSRPLDPSDNAPYAYDWSTVLGEGEKVAEILRITVSAVGASLGVQIDDRDAYSPIIGEDGTKTEIWLLVSPAQQFNAAFSNNGVQVGIAQQIRTDSTPPKTYERTGVVNVRQG